MNTDLTSEQVEAIRSDSRPEHIIAAEMDITVAQVCAAKRRRRLRRRSRRPSEWAVTEIWSREGDWEPPLA